ncbi:MAG TPA: dihydropteroate synthase, partial [Hyphomicrobiaceae bacterium]|nr:dihydropteroate synthase [Hyphomicrobiaceae bacterium]
MTARLYIRPLARIAPPARDRSPRLLPALAVAGRGDLLFAAAELIEREGGRVVRRSYMAADILAGGPSEAAGLPSLLDNLRRPRAPIAGLALDRPRTMGIVNVTPDSFADGGRYHARDAAIAHALQLEAEGADILDIGGESTRPGADPVDAEEEWRRVGPVIEALAPRTRARLSIDTRKAEVMRRAAQAGVHLINDVSALRHDPASLETAA